MTHTFTTVYRDYPADTFRQAAQAMLRDPDIWEQASLDTESLGTIESGGNKGYAVNNWEWHPKDHYLRVWFR